MEYRAVKKSLGQRICELMDSLQVVRDSLQAVRQGRVHQLVPLYGQLRALLAEKSSNNVPLLLSVAEEVGVQLHVYVMPGINDPAFPEELRESMLLHVSGFPVTVERVLPAQSRITVRELLAHEVVQFRDRRYKLSSIVAFFANKAGGAHYSTDLPQDFAELISFGLFGQPVLVNHLTQLGQVVFELGKQLLKGVVDQEIHLVTAVPRERVGTESYAVDNLYQHSSMRWFLRFVPPMWPQFGIVGFRGEGLLLSVERLLDWRVPRHLTLRHDLDDSLNSRLSMAVDGVEVGAIGAPLPVFLPSDPLFYDTYQNRSHDGSGAGLGHGLAELLVLSSTLSATDHAHMVLYVDEKRRDPEQRMVCFQEGGFGRAEPGTKELKMTGSVVLTSAREFCPTGQWSDGTKPAD